MYWAWCIVVQGLYTYIPMFFLQPKVNASFYGGSNLTFAIRQSAPQVIMKIDRGVYGVVEINATTDHGLMVMCSWDNFFDRHFTNPDVQFPKLYKECPKLGKSMTNEGDFDFVQAPVNGFGTEIPLKHGKYIINSFFSDEVLDMAQKVLQFNLDVYHEIGTKIPFPQWKRDLRELF